jgi:hypothetical protein
MRFLYDSNNMHNVYAIQLSVVNSYVTYRLLSPTDNLQACLQNSINTLCHDKPRVRSAAVYMMCAHCCMHGCTLHYVRTCIAVPLNTAVDTAAITFTAVTSTIITS